MELYTLDGNFQPVEVIDTFFSCVWTERYRKPGDVSLVVEPTTALRNILAEGTFLQLKESKEVMLLDTMLIEDGKLKATGNTLDAFLKERVVRFSANHEDRYFTYTDVPASIIGHLINEFAATAGGYIPNQEIPTLASDGASDTTGPAVTVAIPYGQLYDAIDQLAETYELGWKIYLDSIDPLTDDYYLKYNVYKGLDRTSDQVINPVVQFSPNMDTLTDVKTLRSISGYKNVAYAYCTTDLGILAPGAAPQIAYANAGAPATTGFDRRILMVLVDDVTTDQVGGSAATLNAILLQRAKDALANNNFTRVMDGQIIPQSEFQFGSHYTLGDIVELADDGYTQRARVTEYIRSQDKEGERAYPTVSVLE